MTAKRIHFILSGIIGVLLLLGGISHFNQLHKEENIHDIYQTQFTQPQTDPLI